MRLALLGAVQSTQTVLQSLTNGQSSPVLVVTLPGDKHARHSDYMDIREHAEQAGSTLVEDTDANSDRVREALRAADVDYLWIVGWSQIVRSPLLAIPKGGVIGYHPSPLPMMRGRAVIPWTILTGLKRTASTLFWMDEGMDSGDIFMQRLISVASSETATTLYDKHMQALSALTVNGIAHLRSGDLPRQPQDHSQASYCARRTDEDGLIDWSRPAEDVWTLIRATTRPYPGAFTYTKGGKMRIWSAELMRDPLPYIGTSGQVQVFQEQRPLVRCGDGRHILLTDFDAGTGVRLHERFGSVPK